jgi:hypothetical protein
MSAICNRCKIYSVNNKSYLCKECCEAINQSDKNPDLCINCFINPRNNQTNVKLYPTANPFDFCQECINDLTGKTTYSQINNMCVIN